MVTKGRRQILQTHLAPSKNIRKARVHPEGSFRSVSLVSVVLARRSLRRGHETSPKQQEGCSRTAAWNLAKNVDKAQKCRQ